LSRRSWKFAGRDLQPGLLLLAPGATGPTKTPSPALLVLDKEDNLLSVIDPATSKTVARIATGEGPHEVTVSDDGELAFVTNYGARTPGDTLSVMDLVAQKELRRVDLGALRRPHGISFAHGKVWFTAEQPGRCARSRARALRSREPGLRITVILHRGIPAKNTVGSDRSTR